MSFPRYEKYKDSGVEWLGEVPEHWETTKFRHAFKESPEKIESEVIGQMLSVSGYRGIEIKEYDDENRRRLDEDLIGYRIVRPGQLVVNTMWLNYAGLGVSAFEGHVSPAYRSYWITPEIDQHYIHHLMRCDRNVKGYTKHLTGIRPNSLQMSRDDLMSFPVLIPPLHEQHTIAAFLDRETAKIDALVAEQQRLVTLLAEKRQAVISHAVTKGLNPDAPMKDSGIEWLGEVPEHWEVVPVKRLTTHITSGPRGWSDLTGDEGAAFFQSQHIGCLMDVALDDPKRLVPPTDTDAERARLQIDDVVICITGGRTGAVAHVPEHIEEAYINQHVCLLRPQREIVGRFLAYGLFSTGSQEQLACASYGLKQGLGLDQVRSTFLASPPSKEEQMGIVLFLDKQTARLDALTKEAERGIELLKERRAALISAAVTGKIDVRGLGAKEQ